eukprot:c24854_g1_i2 orf=424-2616(-)
MQSGGHYGIPDMQQYVLGCPPQLFAHPQEFSGAPHHRQHSIPFQQHQPVLSHQQHLSQQQLQSVQHHHPTHSQPQPYQQLQQHPLIIPHHYQKSQRSPQLAQPLASSDSAEKQSPVAPRPLSQFNPVLSAGDPLGDDDGTPDESERGAGCNRWPTEETISLLRVRSEMDATFRDSGLKAPLWEEVSRKLAELGYHRSAKKCKEKFENVHKYYKKTKDGKGGRQDGRSYRFFTELEALHAAHNNDSGGSGSRNNGAVGFSIPQKHEVLMTDAGNCSAATEGVASVPRPDTSSGFNLSSDTSEDDDYDDPQENFEPGKGKKRKHRSWVSIKIFFENLAKQVMEKQEALHRKFLETIERRDQERLIREEAYRRQEMARMNREQELRAQEHALAATRDAALVAFLQKVTGQNVQLPQVSVPPTLNTPPDIQDDQEKEPYDINTRRWPKVEVHALIRLRSGMEPRFQEAGPKAQLWEEISAAMACMDFNRSAKRCKEKWENINKYFRKTKDSCRKRPENAKTCPYFHYLDALYQRGILSSPNSKYNRIESHSESLLESSREDHEQDQGGNTEMLAIVAAGENEPGRVHGKNDPAGQSCSSQENETAVDHISKDINQLHSLSDCNGDPSTSSGLNFDGVHASEGLPGSNVSLKMEGFVKDILEMQQQQHQKLIAEYERMEHAREIREQERSKQHEIHIAQEPSQSNTRDNAALMALVHKLAGNSSTFTMSAPPGTE